MTKEFKNFYRNEKQELFKKVKGILYKLIGTKGDRRNTIRVWQVVK